MFFGEKRPVTVPLAVTCRTSCDPKSTRYAVNASTHLVHRSKSLQTAPCYSRRTSLKSARPPRHVALWPTQPGSRRSIRYCQHPPRPPAPKQTHDHLREATKRWHHLHQPARFAPTKASRAARPARVPLQRYRGFASSISMMGISSSTVYTNLHAWQTKSSFGFVRYSRSPLHFGHARISKRSGAKLMFVSR